MAQKGIVCDTGTREKAELRNGGTSMGCMVMERNGMTEIWAPKGTPEEEIRQCVAWHKRPKHMVVVYRSGYQPLPDMTSELLQKTVCSI